MKPRYWYGLLLLPFIAMVWPPLYSRTDPTLFGFPFFYWYLVVWIALAGLICWVVLMATSRGNRV